MTKIPAKVRRYRGYLPFRGAGRDTKWLPVTQQHKTREEANGAVWNYICARYPSNRSERDRLWAEFKVWEERALDPKKDPVRIVGTKGRTTIEGILWATGGYRGENGEWYSTFSVRAPNRKTLQVGLTSQTRTELLRRWGIVDAIEARLKEQKEALASRKLYPEELTGYVKALEFVLRVIEQKEGEEQ